MSSIPVDSLNLQKQKEPNPKIINSQPLQTEKQTKQIEESNLPTTRVKKKRRHHRKPKIVRDPEEIKQLRLERLNIKRQVHWDNRFVLETIPDLFERKAKRRQNMSRGKYPLHSAYVEKERPRLPQLNKQRLHDTISRQNHKSFKIRQIKKEKQESLKAKQQKQEDEKEIKQKKMTKREKNKERLLFKLQEKTKIYPINKYYKQLLTDLIIRASQKRHRTVRTILDKQINSIGANDNIYTRLERLAKQRIAMVQSIQESGTATILKSYLDFQIHSLLLVEEILKYKAFWQAIYQDNLRFEKKVHFYLEQKHYLLQMSKEVANIAAKDPFLVEKTAALQKLANNNAKEQELQERKQMMLKIRACELLLIEEELLASI